MTTDHIFQVSDLANRRTEVLAAARDGSARLRDTDGSSLVLLRESHVRVLEGLRRWSNAYIRLERLLAREQRPSADELGDEAWLRVFDSADQREFLDELREILVCASADNSLQPIEDLIGDWRRTASELDDPVRRSVLLSKGVALSDLQDVARPE